MLSIEFLIKLKNNLLNCSLSKLIITFFPVLLLILKSIEVSINKIYKHFILNPNGRIVYVGAGTSGRIAVQDGVELTPTFGWPRNKIKQA